MDKKKIISTINSEISSINSTLYRLAECTGADFDSERIINHTRENLRKVKGDLENLLSTLKMENSNESTFNK